MSSASSTSSDAFLTTADEDVPRAHLDELLTNDQVLHRFEHCVFDSEDLEGVDPAEVVRLHIDDDELMRRAVLVPR